MILYINDFFKFVLVYCCRHGIACDSIPQAFRLETAVLLDIAYLLAVEAIFILSLYEVYCSPTSIVLSVSLNEATDQLCFFGFLVIEF